MNPDFIVIILALFFVIILASIWFPSKNAIVIKYNDTEHGINYPTSIFIGYLLGVWLTPYMYLDFRLTDWYNVMTYLWIGFWPLMIIGHFFWWLWVSNAILYLVIFLVVCIAGIWSFSRPYNKFKR